MKILFGYPVSTNVYWRMFRGRMVVSATAKQYKERVGWIAKVNKLKPLIGEVAVCLVLLPKLNKDRTLCKHRLDLDNCIKVMLDALNGIAYIDDKQVVEINARIGKPMSGGGILVEVLPVSNVDGERMIQYGT